MAESKLVIIGAVIVVVLGAIAGFTVLGIWVDQCHLGNGDSLNVRVDNLTLLTKPTDNVLFGWESVFGKPSDEISVHLQSGMCKASNEPREIKQQQTITFGHSLSINSFFTNGVDLWLEESDGGFEGANDYSQKVAVAKEHLSAMRRSFDEGLSEYVQLDYTVTVKGANIFQEHKWFGFIAENLCINAVDFISGPWTGIGKKALMTAAGSKFKKLQRMKSGDIARLYEAIGPAYKAGTLTKKSFFKALMTYQFRAGLKASVKKPLQRKRKQLIREWALNQTKLDEEIHATIQEATEAGIYVVAGNKGLDLYGDINAALNMWSGYIEKLSDSVEFCLSEVLPPSRDALYHVYLTVTR